MIRALLLPSLATFLYLLTLPWWLWHPKLRHGKRMRLGLYPRHQVRIADSAPIWLHGASAGDINALLPTATRLRQRYPHLPLLLTTITNSGWTIAQQHRDMFAHVAYAPLDLPWAVKKFIDHFRPRLLVLEYAELWPNWLRCLRAHRIPVVWHNGRLKPRKLLVYRMMFALTGNLLKYCQLLLMCEPQSYGLAQQLGIVVSKLQLTGNTKFDRPTSPSTQYDALAMPWPRLGRCPHQTMLWVAGSTHAGEEGLLLQVFAALRQRFQGLSLVIVPRYPERSDQIIAQAAALKLAVQRWSCYEASSDAAHLAVLVVDSMGELMRFYQASSVTFVGGSFVRRGGQNLMEPASCGKPVLFGPHTYHFAELADTLEAAGGGKRCHDAASLQSMVDRLLSAPRLAEQMGKHAQQVAAKHHGAADRSAAAIGSLLPQLERYD